METAPKSIYPLPRRAGATSKFSDLLEKSKARQKREHEERQLNEEVQNGKGEQGQGPGSGEIQPDRIPSPEQGETPGDLSRQVKSLVDLIKEIRGDFVDEIAEARKVIDDLRNDFENLKDDFEKLKARKKPGPKPKPKEKGSQDGNSINESGRGKSGGGGHATSGDHADEQAPPAKGDAGKKGGKPVQKSKGGANPKLNPGFKDEKPVLPIGDPRLDRMAGGGGGRSKQAIEASRKVRLSPVKGAV